jgi:hypothetical protein
MNENQVRQGNLVETTDCLEAVGVFRGWKNFFSIIVVLCLLLLQISFWAVNTGYIKLSDSAESNLSAVPAGDPGQIEDNPAEPAAEPALPAPEQPVGQLGPLIEEETPEPLQKSKSLFGLTFEHLAWLIRFANGVLILTATLYLLTILFSLKVSLIGRLGGINHISRAFFLSLVMLVLLLPWQRFFGSFVVGATYTPEELVKWCTAETEGIFSIILHYLRFTGYWVLVFLLLLLSQMRSSRWAKAILRRLEVI